MFYNYKVYEDGRVYSLLTNKFLKADMCSGYMMYTLSIDNKPKRYKAHRLVAMLFLENHDETKNIVNHIDGNKLNNHFSNLEWCDYYSNNKHARDMGLNNVSESNKKRWENPSFRQKMSKKFSEINQGKYNHRNNPRFKYSIIYNDKEITRTELRELLGLSQSATDRKIKMAANGEICHEFKSRNITVTDITK